MTIEQDPTTSLPGAARKSHADSRRYQAPAISFRTALEVQAATCSTGLGAKADRTSCPSAVTLAS